MPQDKLKATIEQLAASGPRDFYEGDLAKSIAADVQDAGGALSVSDLAAFRAHGREPLKIPYRGGTVFATPELTAGPTLARALHQLQDFKPGHAPDATAYTAYVETIRAAYRERLKGMGDADGRRALGAEYLAPACTTHFSVVDRHGNMAAVTQTLLSGFGSRFVTPQNRDHHEQRHHVVRPDAGHHQLACAGQALPLQLHAGGGENGRWRATCARRIRRPAHHAGGDADPVLCDGFRHGP